MLKFSFTIFLACVLAFCKTTKTTFPNPDWAITTPRAKGLDEAQMMYGKALTDILQKTMKDYLTEKVTDPIGLGE